MGWNVEQLKLEQVFYSISLFINAFTSTLCKITVYFGWKTCASRCNCDIKTIGLYSLFIGV